MSEPATPVSGWNHMPAVPLRTSPFFSLPFRPRDLLPWLWRAWFPVSERLLILATAAISYLWFQPPLAETATLSANWIALLFVRNLVLMTLVAGGLHLYFYVWRREGEALKYDRRPLMQKGKQFTWGGQVRDNMFWTLASGVPIWTAYEVLMFWAMANGYAPVLSAAAHPVWFVVLFLLIPVWESAYFYVIHRALHWPPLYRTVHALHHRNIVVGPWSGMSMHPVEHVIFLGSVLIHWLVASHPLHILYHMQFLTLTAATTHCGYEGLKLGERLRLRLGTFHHQMHHRYFECNYGSLEAPCDKVFGTFHDGTAEADTRMQERRRRMHEA